MDPEQQKSLGQDAQKGRDALQGMRPDMPCRTGHQQLRDILCHRARDTGDDLLVRLFIRRIQEREELTGTSQ